MIKFMRSTPLMALVVLVPLLAGCGKKQKGELTYVARDVETLYTLGTDTLEKQQYNQAGLIFDEVERQHPYSEWARRAQLMSAYSYYKANHYDECILAAQRFLSLHPGNKDAAYAYYLIAVSYYEQISDVGRDQKNTEKTLAALTELINRYPKSDYAVDARVKLDLTKDHLAGKEMEVGRWYEKRAEYLAAISRFRQVLEKYQTTSHTPEAMDRLVECYLHMGLRTEAAKTAAVLGYNFPGTKWYKHSYDLIHKAGLEIAATKS